MVITILLFTAQCCLKTLSPTCGQGLGVKISGMLSLLQTEEEWKGCAASLNGNIAGFMKTNFILKNSKRVYGQVFVGTLKGCIM